MKKRKNEKKKRRKLLLLLIMVLLTGIIFSTSVFAWFTSNQTVTVQQIDVNVSSSNGLQLSVDGINWKPYVTEAEIAGASSTYSAAVNQVPTSDLSPVSTGKVIDSTSGLMNMYLGTITTSTDGASNILTATKSTETNTTTGGAFLAFDLFFQQTAATAQQIYLTSNSSITSTSAYGIQNASRVAFINKGNTALNSTTANIQALNVTTNAPIIWEPNYDAHTQAAVNNASSVYGKTFTVGSGNSVDNAFYGVKAEIPGSADIPLNSHSTDYFTQYNSDIQTTAAGISTSAYQPVFTLATGITKMRIYVWVEGQDVDCENNAAGTPLTINLQFSLLTGSGS